MFHIFKNDRYIYIYILYYIYTIFIIYTILYNSAPAEARALDCDALKGTFKYVTIKRHKRVSASGFPRHPLL